VTVPITPTTKIWMDGELIDWDKATVHVLTHSLHYGMGVFEGIRAYATANGPAIFRLREHTKRLFRGARILQMDLPYSEDEVFEAIKLTVLENGLDSCYIRPLAYFGYGEMGMNIQACKVRLAIAVWPWGAYLGDEAINKGIRLKVSSWARNDPRSVPTAAKCTGMYVNSSLAKLEAARAGYDEALMCTTSGLISEGTGENVFVVRQGNLYIPPPSSAGSLEGITADTVATIARDLGHSVTEREMRRTDLYMADEAFLTGTAAEVVPIGSVDDRLVGTGEPGPITREIQEIYFATVRGTVDQYKDWLEYVT
jgi:branched-chain amino acid aminotransferase